MIRNFVTDVVKNGGDVFPLLIDSKDTKGSGLTNCSIFNDNGNLLVNLRNVEYTLFHSEKKKFCHPWGPVVYVHPENDWKLRTNNFLGTLSSDMSSFFHYSKVDTSDLDVEALWEFVGLEDARVVRWNGKLYLTGVRRDTTTNGEGRMELSEIELVDNTYKEVSRQRIPIPGKQYSYCEKNWMPILDLPYHFVKWCNPTEVVKYDPDTQTTETVFLGKSFDAVGDFRGGSQVLEYKDNYRICLTHLTRLFKSESGRKDCTYTHRFVVWDKDWNLVKFSDEFNFLGADVEFAVGACWFNGDLLVTTGYQDNSSFLVQIPFDFLDNFIGV